MRFPRHRNAVVAAPSGGDGAHGVADRIEDALRVDNVSKSFAGTTVLHGVSLSIKAGEVRAVVGGNGSGKSTLVKILAGYHEPDAGSTIWLGGQELPFGAPEMSHRLGLRVVHQDLGLVNEASVSDNLLLVGGYPSTFGTINGARSAREVSKALERVRLDVDPREMVGTLSAAEQVRVAIARALRDDGTPIRLLVLDEATAALAIEDVQSLLETVQAVAANGVGVLYVSHRLGEIFQCAERVTVLRDGHLVATESIENLDHDRLVTLMAGREVTKLAQANQAWTQRERPADATPVLTVQGLGVGPVRGLDLSVQHGEVLGIAGVNGSGRDVVLGAIFGAIHRRSGTVRTGGVELKPLRPDAAIEAGVAYLPGDRKVHGGFMDLTATDNLTLVDLKEFVSRGWLWHRKEATEVRAWIQRLDIRPSNGGENKLQTFSGGNQQKVLVAKWLRCDPTTLLLDEPTQGVDVIARRELHEVILFAASRGAGVVVSSSDFEELEEICDRVLVLHEGQIAKELVRPSLSAAQMSRYALGGRLEEVSA